MARNAPATPCGLEIRLLRRLPALAARLRGRAAGGGRRGRDRAISPKPPARWRRGRTTCRWSKARSPRRTTPSASSKVRRQSKCLVTIGACATAGGIQALRNFADVNEFVAAVYASPQYIKTLATSTPISAHVKVDFELRGCPINKGQLLEVISAFLAGRKPAIAGAQRLRRMQAARHRLRHGAGHALPRPGHACRLRRDLSRLSPRLLRLLRPDGTPEHRRAGGRMATSRRHAARHPAGVPHLQRRRRTVPQGKRGPWRLRRSGSTLIARVEGESGARPADQGRARHLGEAEDLRAAAAVRGAPARPRLRRGARHHRPHLRHLPDRLSDERGARDGGRVRRHGRRAAARAAPADLLRRMDREPRAARGDAARAGLPGLPGRHPDGARSTATRCAAGLALKKAGNELMRLLGGREIHPVNVRVGGFYRVPEPAGVRAGRRRS